MAQCNTVSQPWVCNDLLRLCCNVMCNVLCVTSDRTRYNVRDIVTLIPRVTKHMDKHKKYYYLNMHLLCACLICLFSFGKNFKYNIESHIMCRNYRLSVSENKSRVPRVDCLRI